jgi:hypothetical protein
MVNFRPQLLTLKDSNQINFVVNFRFRSNEDGKCLHSKCSLGAAQLFDEFYITALTS